MLNKRGLKQCVEHHVRILFSTDLVINSISPQIKPPLLIFEEINTFFKKIKHVIFFSSTNNLDVDYKNL